MPKIHSHEDSKIDAEFENIYNQTDRYITDTITPKNPKSGLMWFNPSDGKLKIFKNNQLGWESIN